jgi:hypothetical protein
MSIPALWINQLTIGHGVFQPTLETIPLVYHWARLTTNFGYFINQLTPGFELVNHLTLLIICYFQLPLHLCSINWLTISTGLLSPTNTRRDRHGGHGEKRAIPTCGAKKTGYYRFLLLYLFWALELIDLLVIICYYMLLHVITCYYQLLYPFSAAQVAPQVSMLAPIPGPVTLPSTPPAGRSPPCHHSAGQWFLPETWYVYRRKIWYVSNC